MLSSITDVDTYVATRTTWHTLAERVLAPARHAATGKIGLRATDGGITTPVFGDDRALAIIGTDLVIRDGAATTRAAITTLRAAAAAAGTNPDAATGVFTATTPDDPDVTLVVDPASADALATWFAFGDTVLEQLRSARPDDEPSEIQLWPEHFDLALDLGPETGRANFGASPGDGRHQLPYLYVGPWQADDNPFWNAGTFARLGYGELQSGADPAVRAATFFAQGYAAANS